MPDIRPAVELAPRWCSTQTYEPLCVVSVRRATILVLAAKAVCVADGDGILHSARDGLPVPLVVRLTRYVRVPYRTHIGLSRRASSPATAAGAPTAGGRPRPSTTCCHAAGAAGTPGRTS